MGRNRWAAMPGVGGGEGMDLATLSGVRHLTPEAREVASRTYVAGGRWARAGWRGTLRSVQAGPLGCKRQLPACRLHVPHLPPSMGLCSAALQACGLWCMDRCLAPSVWRQPSPGPPAGEVV